MVYSRFSQRKEILLISAQETKPSHFEHGRLEPAGREKSYSCLSAGGFPGNTCVASASKSQASY